MYNLIAQATSSGKLGTGEPAQFHQLNEVFGRVIAVALGFGAIVLFVMLVVAGFKRMTASGDPKAQAAAKNTFTYAIYGIVLLVLAFLILTLISFFTGVETIKTFSVFQS